MSSAFSIALSALSADSAAINVVGNNLANMNTTGYKDADVNFEDLMAENLGTGANSAQAGMGVGQIGTLSDYSQGTITSTSGATDAAIQGNGFFVVTNAANQTLYTRDGAFQVNSAGDLVTATGENVQGWSAVNGVVNPNGPTGNISVPIGATVPAVATSAMTLGVNLDAQAATGTSFSAPVQVYDSQGVSHTLTVNFTETSANNWGYTVTIPAADLGTGGHTSLASGTMTFDANGNLTAPAASSDPQSIQITGLADGAAPMTIGWNLFDSSGNSNITQYAEASGVGSTTQNGYAAGQITNVSLQNGGLVVANYSNGQQTTVGQLAMASIPNPESLTSVGDNNLEASASTGSISVGAANTGGLGQIMAGSLESSNVDMATEFTKLLSYQNSYEAASRVITTSDQLLQDTVNLIHE
jgi:flagellar hook protein FlgE